MPDASTVALAVGSVLCVSLVPLAGLVALSLDARRVRQAATIAVAFAAGALLGDAFIHLIPEALARSEGEAERLMSSLLTLSGIVLFFVVEKLLRHRHGPLHEHFHGRLPERHELAMINLIGDGIHNFIDGVLIGTSYLAGPTVGLSTTVAVLLHEVPQELGELGVLVHSGLPLWKATAMSALSGGTALLGTLLALVLGSIVHEPTLTFALPIAAGGFVYLATADLMPELQHDKRLSSLALHTGLLMLGIATMGFLTLLE